eukprot:CAMPEP_0204296354 /NCGR_PEP_ID=MMETSP0468-20130131/71305_1 /ASSEMBLY_ACC=CAM_ASM_000383 /TAXON_ID=2969 /ORGANISM="Oxyrrhis marina" /LENGTH=73 /DNA_ID=CAMNT_0051275051 /DNA_START=620 /DNA_END=838 /DNA_ORIENTATION=+
MSITGNTTFKYCVLRSRKVTHRSAGTSAWSGLSIGPALLNATQMISEKRTSHRPPPLSKTTDTPAIPTRRVAS